MKQEQTTFGKLKLFGIAGTVVLVAVIGIILFFPSSPKVPIKAAEKAPKPIIEKPIEVVKTPQDLRLDSMLSALQTDGNHVREIYFKGVKYDVFIADLRSVQLQMHWKDKQGKLIKNIKTLKTQMEQKGEKPLFVTNGGIYNPKFAPEGLYIENGKVLSGLNNKNKNGNFYLNPNGVFLITNNQSASVVTTKDFPKLHKQLKSENLTIDFAVQSGPQLLINGKIHPKFREKSPNKYIRNGVGIFNNNSKKVIFAISQEKVNLYNFASFFYEVMKCDDALYLDGFVSRMFIDNNPNRQDLDGNFSTMISAIKK